MTTSPTVNHPDFWQEIYDGGRAGWDLGTPTPAFQRLLTQENFPPGRLIVLGAGRGHDAREFARRGFDVAAVDFADEPVRAMRALMDDNSQHQILQHDIFGLPPEFDDTFDYVLEYTCFCAIDPSRRAEYADLVTRLLKPGGIYIDLVFPLDSFEGGPPFAVSIDQVLDLFTARNFTLLRRESPHDSVKPRRGREELLVWSKT